MQKPVLNCIRTKNVKVYEIHATTRRELAKYYQVMTVPTTIVLNPEDQPVFLNPGFADESQLLSQIQKV